MKKGGDKFADSDDSTFDESSSFAQTTEERLLAADKAALVLIAKWTLLVAILGVLFFLTACASGSGDALHPLDLQADQAAGAAGLMNSIGLQDWASISDGGRTSTEALVLANLLDKYGIPGYSLPGQIFIDRPHRFDPVSKTDGQLNVSRPGNLRNANVFVATDGGRDIMQAMRVGADANIIALPGAHADVAGSSNPQGIYAVSLGIARNAMAEGGKPIDLVNSVLGLQNWDALSDGGRLAAVVALYSAMDVVFDGSLPGNLGGLASALGFLNAVDSGKAGAALYSGLVLLDTLTATAATATSAALPCVIGETFGSEFLRGLSFVLALQSTGFPCTTVFATATNDTQWRMTA